MKKDKSKNYSEGQKKLIKRVLKEKAKEAKRQNRDYKAVGFKVLKSSMYVMIFTMIITMMTATGLIYYFNKYAYDNDFKKVSITKYLEDNKDGVIKYESENSVHIRLNQEVLSTTLLEKKYVIEENLPFKYKIIDLSYNLDNRVMQFNGRRGVTLLPFSAKVNLYVEEDDLVMNMENLHVGAKAFKIPNFLISGILDQKDQEVRIPLKELNIFPKYMDINSVRMDEKQIIFNIGISEEEMVTTMQQYGENANSLIKEFYETRDEESQLFKVSSILYDKDEKSNSGMVLVRDLFSEQKLLPDFMTLLNQPTLDDFYDDFGYVIRQDKAEVKKQKQQVLIDMSVEIANRLLNQLDNYIEANSLYILGHHGKLYDMVNQKYITVNTIKQYYENESTVFLEEVDKCSYYYDTDNERFLVKYRINSKQTLLVTNSTYELKSNEEANELYPEKEDSADLVQLKWFDEETTTLANVVRQYNGFKDRVFFRYLVKDGKYCYAIASHQSNYQELEAYAFEKNGDSWKVISRNDTYYNLNVKNPEFNVELLPDYNYRNIRLKEISDVGKGHIVRQINIKRGSYSSLRFASLIDNYIYAFQSNDNQFVIKVEAGRLGEVLTRQEAEQKWDLPPLLMRIE